MDWHVASLGEKRNAYVALMGKPEVVSHLEDQGMGGRMLKCIRKKQDGLVGGVLHELDYLIEGSCR